LRPAVIALALLAGAVVSAGPALALVPRPSQEDLDRRVIPAPLVDQVPEPAEEGGSGPGAAAAAGFRRRHGGAWHITFDRRTGRPQQIDGAGVPLFPGLGNGLPPAAFGLAGAPSRLDDVEPLGRAFLDAEADLLRPNQGELRLNPDRSAWLEDGALAFLDYDWFVDGVPLDGARVYLQVRHGNLIQFGTVGLGVPVPKAAPLLDAADALDRLFEHALGRRPTDVVVEEPHLVFVPRAVGAPGGSSGGAAAVPWAGGLLYRLAWRAAFKRAGDPATWAADIDARSGEILSFEDRNRYARVTGGVHPRTVTDGEVVRPFTQARVVTSTGAVSTGDSGTYLWPGGPAFTALDGTYIRPYCIGCDTPSRAFAFTDRGTGDLFLGTGGLDNVGNGASTPAERNAYYHQTRVRMLAAKWLASVYLNGTVPTTVNIVDTCNAYWDGQGTNFFRSGGGCNNTGEIADVMYHEWGHGLDQNTNLGDGSTGEATADVNSMHVTHDAAVGPGFSTSGAPVRLLDSNQVGYQARVDNLNTNCIICAPGQCSNGVFGHEVHCEGEIYGQAQWDLAKALIAKHGFNTGWQVSERIFYLSLAQANTMNPSSAQSVYSAYLAADDDDGILGNGTPNCREIFNAFSAHGIAPTASTACAADTAGCARPAQPAVTITPGHGKVVLDWTTSAGAANYRVLRAEFSPTQVYLPASGFIVGGTHFEDTNVQPGVPYYYVVEAQTSGGCRSTIENPATASPLAEGRLALAGATLSDIPAGNRSGFADPGESVDLTLALADALPAGTAPAATGLLSTATPNVTVTNASASYGAIAAGATASGSNAYRIALGSGLVCGQDATFNLAADDGAGGPTVNATVPLLIGQRTTRYFEDFDHGVAPWTTVAGSPAATAGQWVQGTPILDGDPTVAWLWAPMHDATAGPTGQALITGQNSADATGDIDGGETIALSPVIDLSGATAARLSYKRWWADSSLTDTGDGMSVEVSGNGGSSWVVAETVGAAARNLGWQPVEIRLETLVPLNNQFRMRVRAHDGGIDSNVEAGIDDVRVEQVACDLTPPCFTAATFAGLASVAQSTSCGETDLSWAAATSNCQNAQIHYNVYRSTTAGFTPGPANRIAGGVSATTFHDTLLVPGTTYHYLVRAEDSRSGEETNTVDRPFTPAVTTDTVPPVFTGLATVSSGDGCGENLVTWLPAAETCSVPVRYDVYRSTSPGFTPGAANLAASIIGTSYIDRALTPLTTYYYKVRAMDGRGNEEQNLVEGSAAARTLPLVVYHQDFESGAGGWGVTSPNTAITGNWELGDPQGTGVQPEDDATPPPGVNAWVTGLQAGSGVGSFDVDSGVTTLISPNLDVSSLPNATLQMSLFYSNDQGANPGEDAYIIEVSGDGGANWVQAFFTLGDVAPWTPVQVNLGTLVPLTSQVRLRATAQDLGAGGSLVEAGLDEVSIYQPGGACTACSGPTTPVGTIQVARSGDDILLDWSADPASAAAYNVYVRSGPGLGTLVRAGTTTAKTFTHAGAARLTGNNFFYVVTTVDSCGRESAAF
jgi:hypothetical protein